MGPPLLAQILEPGPALDNALRGDPIASILDIRLANVSNHIVSVRTAPPGSGELVVTTDLADKHAIVVYRINGWWRFRHKKPEICAQKTRYALVVSIETDHQEVDVYAPVMAMIGVER